MTNNGILGYTLLTIYTVQSSGDYANSALSDVVLYCEHSNDSTLRVSCCRCCKNSHLVLDLVEDKVMQGYYAACQRTVQQQTRVHT
jgi:hypothetical protein